jgi:hypothetical protein
MKVKAHMTLVKQEMTGRTRPVALEVDGRRS